MKSLKDILFPEGILFLSGLILILEGVNILAFQANYRNLGYTFIVLGIMFGLIWFLRGRKIANHKCAIEKKK